MGFRKLLTICGTLALLTVGCANNKIDAGDSNSTTSGGLNVTISTAYQTSPTDFVTQATCSATGTATSPDTETCTVNIPEAQLYYSKLKFSITSAAGACAIKSFTPYRYRRSQAAAYTPPGETTAVDCSDMWGDSDPVECWGGPAPEMVPSFGDYTAIFVTGDDDLEKTADAPNEKLKDASRYVSNDLPTASRGVANFSGVDYVASSIVDYSVVCSDAWGNSLATITIYIKDYDGSSPSTDHYDSWDN